MLNELKNVGLADKEARVYLAMLELGPATMLEIAAKAGVNRPTAYVQIESLKKLGLATTQTKGKKQLFMAESPSQLEHLVEREQKEIDQQREDLQKLLPELSAMHALGEEKPLVRYFEGKEGLLAMQEEFLKMKGKEILGIFSIDAVLDLFPPQGDTYSSRRVSKQIRSRSIYTSKSGPVLAENDAQSLRESKYLPPERFSFNADITIFDDNVAITSLVGKIGGSIITHKEIAQSFRSLFEIVWNAV